MTADLEIDASKEIPTFSKKLQVKQLNLAKMSEALGIRDGVAGIGNVDSNLTSQGRSVAEMMGSMNGRIIVAIQDGFVKQRYLDLVSLDFTTGVVEQIFSLSGTPPGEKAEIQCLFGNLDIQNGIVDVAPVVMITPNVTVFGSGDINLKNERLNLSVSSEPTRKTAVVKSSIGQLARIFKLTGTLANPKLSIDPVESSMLLARKFGGKTITNTTLAIETLLGSKDTKANPCLQVMESSDETPSDVDSPASKTADKPKKSLKKTIKDAGKSILDIFKKP